MSAQMATAYKSPGVYLQDMVLQPPPPLATGVPGFVGFARPLSQADLARPFVALENKGAWDARFASDSDDYLADAVAGFFNNGGERCYVAWADPAHRSDATLGAALDSLGAVDELDLVAIPDAMALRAPDGTIDKAAVAALQGKVIAHCTRHANRFAILDALPGSAADTILAQRARIVNGLAEPISAALYFPWVRTLDGRLRPPCGRVAGIYARSDDKAGVFKAPANEEVFGIVDLEINVDQDIQDQLNPDGVNCLRAFPGRGIRLWGARTLSRDPAWRYINVRRMFLHLHRWIEQNQGTITFEPNGPPLWVRIQRELDVYLTAQWQAGALKGDTPEQAFFVKCDAETNPSERRDIGEVVTDVGLAPTVPSEFVVVRIVRRPGSRETETAE